MDDSVAQRDALAVAMTVTLSVDKTLAVGS